MQTVQLDPSGRWLFAGGSDERRYYAWDLRRDKLLTWTRPTEALPPIDPDEEVPRPKPEPVKQRQEEHHLASVYAAAATFAPRAPEKAP